MNEFLNKISIDKLVRYGYPGFLILLTAILFECETKDYIKEIGGLVTTILSLTVGSAFYVVYRYIIGELVLYQAMHLIHNLYEQMTRKPSSPHTFLRKIGKRKIGWFKRRVLYNLLRRNYFEPEQSKKYDFAHTEIHLVYITGVILGLVTTMFRTDKLIVLANSNGELWIASATIIIVAIMIDIQQHSVEYRRFVAMKKDITKWIENNYFKDS